MAGSILTPVSIWSEFKIEGERNAEIVEETVKDGIVLTRFYFDGKAEDGVCTRVFCVSAREEKPSLLPCVFVLPDLEKDIDEEYLITLAKRGYFAVSADLSGVKDGKKHYTVYPAAVDYAIYEKAKNRLGEVSGDVKDTAWYVWDCAAKYALSYFCSLPFITGVGAVGVGTGASVLWHIAAGEDKLSCAVFLFDAGWKAYFDKGNYKFDAKTVDFDDNDLKYLAGIDAQAYASFIKVPSFVVSATNGEKYDFDRAYDTVTRINQSAYAAIDYSVNSSEVLDYSVYNDVNVFLDGILLKGFKPEKVFPSLPDLDCYIEDGFIEAEVDALKDGLKKVVLYVAEGTGKQFEAAWEKVGEIEADDLCDGQFFFKYSPYPHSGACKFFVRAEYENGFTVASNVIYKKFTEKEVGNAYKSNVIYSSRNEFSESVFAPAYSGGFRSFADPENEIMVSKGPMDVYGIACDCGLITYKINSAKDKPSPDSIFIIDVYAESDATVYVSLIAGEDGEKTEYFSTLTCAALKAWKNFKIPLNKFKSAEGMGLKDYSSVKAIKITGDGKYLINNFLWI